MNDLTQTDQEDAVFAGGYELWRKTKIERDQLLHENRNWERSHAIAQAENEMLRQRCLDLDHKANFYMRHSTELTANLANIKQILDVSLAKAGEYVASGLGLAEIANILAVTMQRSRDAAYRPTNAAPDRPQPQIAGSDTVQRSTGQAQDDGAPVPRFLTAGDRAAAAVQEALEDAGAQPAPPQNDMISRNDRIELDRLTGKDQ